MFHEIDPNRDRMYRIPHKEHLYDPFLLFKALNDTPCNILALFFSTICKIDKYHFQNAFSNLYNNLGPSVVRLFCIYTVGRTYSLSASYHLHHHSFILVSSDRKRSV